MFGPVVMGPSGKFVAVSMAVVRDRVEAAASTSGSSACKELDMVGSIR